MNQQRTVRLAGNILTSRAVIVEYELLPGGLPIERGNQFMLWESQQPLWGNGPMRSYPLRSDDICGEQVLDDLLLQKTCYVAGLSASSDSTSLMAMLGFEPGGIVGSPVSVSLELDEVSTDFVRVSVSTLPGCVPAECNHWIGVWPGDLVPSGREGCLRRVEATGRQSAFTQTIQELFLPFGSTYTLVYGVGSSWRDIGATLTFQTGSY